MAMSLKVRRARKGAREQNDCLARASYAERHAARATSENDRTIWLTIAAEWHAAAREVGKSFKERPEQESDPANPVRPHLEGVFAE
jgi:hypothetical protein